jgi:thioredoxin-dependent peroxiredoxin
MDIPYTNFKTRIAGTWKDLDTETIFNDKKIIIFSLPGAFTPTCSNTHLPGYESKYDKLLKYVDEVYCISVNDAFVMNAWAKDLNVKKVKMLPDGSGVFTEGMQMLVNKDHLGFGKRSWRYSMFVDNKQIIKQFTEFGKNDSGDDQDPFKVSDADTMLTYLKNYQEGK